MCACVCVCLCLCLCVRARTRMRACRRASLVTVSRCLLALWYWPDLCLLHLFKTCSVSPTLSCCLLPGHRVTSISQAIGNAATAVVVSWGAVYGLVSWRGLRLHASHVFYVVCKAEKTKAESERALTESCRMQSIAPPSPVQPSAG